MLSVMVLSAFGMLPVIAQNSEITPLTAGADQPATALPDSPELKKITDILVILGLKETANRQVSFALAEELSDLNVRQVDADEAASTEFDWSGADTIVATGKSGCQLALQSATPTPILCTLLTVEGFASLDTDIRTSSSESISALVIDQPLNRQMQVAHRVFPALTSFAHFDGFGADQDVVNTELTINLFTYQASSTLPAQLKHILRTHDALIATSDGRLYNASTLSTVLLTAYGYGKPVIGFSRAYVKAGALITSYSTSSQILRQVAQHLRTPRESQEMRRTLVYPKYFSVVENQSVAKSLGLIMEFPVIAGKTYTDEDFKP